MNIILYLIIIGLAVWIAGRELTIQNMRAEIEKAEKQRAKFLQRIQQRDKLITGLSEDIAEMKNMASGMAGKLEWPEEIEDVVGK